MKRGIQHSAGKCRIKLRKAPPFERSRQQPPVGFPALGTRPPNASHPTNPTSFLKLEKNLMSRFGNLNMKAGPGRPKGLANKTTKALKDMILGALDQAGGQAYLLNFAQTQPVAFVSLLARILPTQISGEGGGPVLIKRAEDMTDDELASEIARSQIERAAHSIEHDQEVLEPAARE